MRRQQRSWTALLLLIGVGAVPVKSFGQAVDVSLKVRAIRSGKPGAQQAGAGGVVVWLSAGLEDPEPKPKPEHYQLLQKEKQFIPHLLVIPTGSSVAFPNLDPFFHNVFSLFNGKRFDLGLYETGNSRAVHFDHDGVSYIFCNIHPEMSAVIITLSTPYVAMSSPEGLVTLHAIPPATYEMHVWAEGSSAHDLDALSRRVVIDASHLDLGTIYVTVDSHFRAHKNKFGEDYQDPDESLY